MKIAFYINTLAHGGAERVVTVLANSFYDRGWDVSVITTKKSDYEYVLNANVKRYILELSQSELSLIRRNISRISKLRKLLKKLNPDLAVSFMAEPNFRLLLAAKATNLKTVVSVRNDPSKEYPNIFLRIAANVLFRKASGVVFQTQEARSCFNKEVQEKSVIIFNPVDKIFFDSKYNPLDNLVINCGRLVDQKNQELLINSFKKVVEKHPKAILEIYGDGPLKKKLESQILDLGLEKNVFIKGLVSNILPVLEHASIFVLSSKYEGAPNALMEALAVGVPCVATDCPCGGPRMLIRNMSNGVLVENDSSDDLAAAISELISNKDLSNSISKKAKENAAKFETSVVIDEWENYLSSLIKNIVRLDD